ncbi:hypothetical protein [Intrasporangium mesophilum]
MPFRGAAGTYDKLHQMSNDVRYQSGLRASVDQAVELWGKFDRLCQDGVLTADPEGPGFESHEGPRLP